MVSPSKLADVFDATPEQIVNALYESRVEATSYNDDGPLYDPAEALEVLPHLFPVRQGAIESTAAAASDIVNAKLVEGLDNA